MRKIASLVYYITAHGYGHGVRSCDIINALRRHDPELAISVVSDLPVDFLRSRIDLPLENFRAGSFDVGMVQLDSIQVDVEATREKVFHLLARRKELIRAEESFLLERGARVVVSDIPAIPIEAARASGIPAVAVGNFAWDWIYEDFVSRDGCWQNAVDQFRDGYRQAALLLRLPFSEPMAAFPKREDVGLVASAGRDRRAELAAEYRIDPEKSWVLLSFTSLDWTPEVIRKIEELESYVFLTVMPLAWPGRNFRAINRHQFSFSDVIATADLVLSKPGYGILSECAVNDKTLVYAERENFREYPVLEAAVKKHLRHLHIPAADLYRGEIATYLDRARHVPPARVPMSSGGERTVAERIAGFI